MDRNKNTSMHNNNINNYSDNNINNYSNKNAGNNNNYSNKNAGNNNNYSKNAGNNNNYSKNAGNNTDYGDNNTNNNSRTGKTEEAIEQAYLYTDSLTVGYHGIPLIKDIVLDLKKGEILTLIGPNGAGKTTILRSLIRQLSLVGGLVYLDRENMAHMKGEDLARKMAVVLTERIQPEMMTCRDIVATGRYPYTGRFGILSGEDHRIVEEAMELVHISELADRDFLKTSDGQKQRVMLARAICQEPDIIVLDEPTSFLDIRYKLEFLSIIQNMSRKRKLSVVMSLHELDLAGRISDKIACVKGDRIDRYGSPEEIFTDGYIPKLYQMSLGSYDERSGNLEMPPVKGIPYVFVLSGNGSGTEVFRRLQRSGIPFATGILWENDLDYPSAMALATEVVSARPFARVEEEALKRARELMKQAKEIICTLDPALVGETYPEYAELYEIYRRRMGNTSQRLSV